MEDKEENSYKELVKYMNPLSYKDVAEDWEKNPKEWYHALITIADLPIVLAIQISKYMPGVGVSLLLMMIQKRISTGMDWFIFHSESHRVGKCNVDVQE